MNHQEKLETLIEEAVQLIPKVNLLVNREYQTTSKEYDLSISQLFFLRTLYLKGEMTMGSISEALHITPPSATTTAEKLIKQELIVRKEPPSDRRVVMVSLSPKGKDLMDRFMAARKKRWRELMEHLLPKEQEKIVSSLRQLVILLEKADQLTTNGKL
jgi:DNA-binding MarR family transcriptional regulator